MYFKKVFFTVLLLFNKKISHLVSPQSASAARSQLDPEHSPIHPGVSSGISYYHGQTIYSREIQTQCFVTISNPIVGIVNKIVI